MILLESGTKNPGFNYFEVDMDDDMLNEVSEKIHKYVDEKIITGYIADKSLVTKIYDHVSNYEQDRIRTINVSILYYLITKSYDFHNKISNGENDHSLSVIYGDYFGTLYHRAVIDFKEHKLNEKIISEYKKMCIDTFEGIDCKPVYMHFTGEQ